MGAGRGPDVRSWAISTSAASLPAVPRKDTAIGTPAASPVGTVTSE